MPGLHLHARAQGSTPHATAKASRVDREASERVRDGAVPTSSRRSRTAARSRSSSAPPEQSAYLPGMTSNDPGDIEPLYFVFTALILCVGIGLNTLGARLRERRGHVPAA